MVESSRSTKLYVHKLYTFVVFNGYTWTCTALLSIKLKTSFSVWSMAEMSASPFLIQGKHLTVYPTSHFRKIVDDATSKTSPVMSGVQCTNRSFHCQNWGKIKSGRRPGNEATTGLLIGNESLHGHGAGWLLLFTWVNWQCQNILDGPHCTYNIFKARKPVGMLYRQFYVCPWTDTNTMLRIYILRIVYQLYTTKGIQSLESIQNFLAKFLTQWDTHTHTHTPQHMG